MLVKTLIAAAALAQAVQAHFTLNHPAWRGDSFEAPASQWLRPCAGINATNNRTEWPLDGGSISLKLGHAFDYVFVNLGLGAEAATFNISLTPNFFNSTGNGTLCIPKLPLPSTVTVTDGQLASLQIVAMGSAGNSMYNCADIVFRQTASLLSGDQCMNTTGSLSYVTSQGAVSADGKPGDKSSASVHGSPTHLMMAAFTIVMAMIVASGLL
ncbi:hypothetical protein DRE_02107 [Drechslerella stenobrocha 248]|uniref:Copper acquisition factor BIM1-like domain-containing protein n=1 Tax=Drechslerella stenobrocha 248 TaxID=1043628 RepID=W7I7N6_9PEZI|nr:hypothetical protein DRE_02107 [Drechslerella stenobrocha 248]